MLFFGSAQTPTDLKEGKDKLTEKYQVASDLQFNYQCLEELKG